ncbi:hypothetical protein ACFQYP_05195 [Nonomuraea antimicrobica]
MPGSAAIGSRRSNAAADMVLGAARQVAQDWMCRPILALARRPGAVTHSDTRAVRSGHPSRERAATIAANHASRPAAALVTMARTSVSGSSKIVLSSMSARPCRTDRSSSSRCGRFSDSSASGSSSDMRPGRDHEPMLAGLATTARCARATPYSQARRRAGSTTRSAYRCAVIAAPATACSASPAASSVRQ